MAFPQGAGRDDPQWEAWLPAMLPRLWLLERAFESSPSFPRRGDGRTSKAALLAMVRPL